MIKKDVKKSERPSRKAINFDLDTNKLYELTGSKTDGYTQIKKFLLNNGFKHKQWSGYVSSEKMTHARIRFLLQELCDRYEWFPDCLNTLDVTKVEQKGKDLHVILKMYKESKKNNVKTEDPVQQPKKYSFEEAARKSAEEILRLEEEGLLCEGWSTSDKGKSKDSERIK
jgi:virulence-associated protein VapD